MVGKCKEMLSGKAVPDLDIVAERTSTAVFPLTAAILLPSGDQARALTLPGWLKRKRRSSPVAMLQASTVSLPNAAAICMLSGDQARASTLWLCVAKRASTLLRAEIASQTCTELSSVPAEAICCP